MKIALYNLEPKYRNLALEKVRVYYQNKGVQVDVCPAILNGYDEIWASSIFTFTDKAKTPPNSFKGGTGFDLKTKLPPEIDAIEPHLNFGFTTRGCIRKCKFCVVPEKEGHIHVVGDLLSLWDGKAKDITLYDNNILALPDHFEMICNQAIDNKLRLDFNQGLDHRLLTTEIVDLLARISHKEYHLAFDYPAYFNSVDRAIDLLQNAGITRSTWLVLTNYNTTFQEDLDRVNYLKSRNQNAYVMRYNGHTTPELTQLARWVNNHSWFHGVTWDQFIERNKVLSS